MMVENEPPLVKRMRGIKDRGSGDHTDKGKGKGKGTKY